MRSPYEWAAGFFLVLAACSNDAAATGQDALRSCAEPSSVQVAAPAPLSFEKDVVPVFERSCTFSACHGNGADTHGIQLTGDPIAIRMRLVGVQAEGAAMPYVEPGAPDQSFLLRKVEGTFCGLEAVCKGGTCGDPMPRDSAPLRAKDQAAIRAWIATGAEL